MLLRLISMWFASVLILFLYNMIHDRVARSLSRNHHFGPYVCQCYYILGQKPLVNKSTRKAILFMMHPMLSLDDKKSILLVLFLKCICSPNRQAEERDNQLFLAIFP